MAELDPGEVKEMSPDEVVDRYHRLAMSIVNRLRRRLRLRVAIEDMESYAMAGLLEAHRRYDPAQGTPFSSYAYYRIRGAIMDGCRSEGWQVPGGRSVHTTRVVDEFLESRADAERDVPPAANLEESLARVSAAIDGVAMIVLMGSTTLEEITSEPATQDQFIEADANREIVRTALNALNDEEREIVVRFHLGEERMEEIGRSLGYSKSWVSRINARALQKMKGYVTDE